MRYLLFLVAASMAWAQTTNGTIVGSVRESSGLAVSGAAVRLTQAGTGVVRGEVSSRRGDFTFPSLVAGE